MTSRITCKRYPFKTIGTKRLNEKTRKVNEAITPIRANNVFITSSLLNKACMWVFKQLGVMPQMRGEINNPLCKKMIDVDIKLLQAGINISERKTRAAKTKKCEQWIMLLR